MRHLVYICRPCLASIRKKQGESLLRRTASSRAAAPSTSRPRIRTLAALHALRSKSTAAANLRIELETSTDFEDFARAVASQFEASSAPSKKKSKKNSAAAAYTPIDEFEEFARPFEPHNAPSTSGSESTYQTKSTEIAPPPTVPETTTDFEDYIRDFEAESHRRDASSNARSDSKSTVAAHPRIDPSPFEEVVHQDFETEADANNALSTTVSGSESPAAAHDQSDAPTMTNSEEFVQPVEVEDGASTESSSSPAGPSIPDSTPEDECDKFHNHPRWHWLSSTGSGPPRSPDAEWEEVEAALFRPGKLTRGKITQLSTEDGWEAFFTTKITRTESIHILSSCQTVEDYFRAIELDPNIIYYRQAREDMARDKWVFWFRQFLQQRRRHLLVHKLGLSEVPKPAYLKLREKWERLTPQARDSRWMTVITKCLESWPQGLPLVVAATAEPRIARTYVLGYVFKFLAYHITEIRQSEKFANSVVDSLLSVLSTIPDRPSLPQGTIYAMMKSASIHKASELYTGLRNCGWLLSLDTKMQFASRFAKDLRYRSQSLEVLGDMVKEDNFNINSLEGTALATSMLAAQIDGRSNAIRKRSIPPPEVTEEVHTALFGLGLRPNIIHLTAIMQSMCQLGQLEKAWEVYAFMQDVGVEPDEQVFLTLLHGSKLRTHHDSAEQVIKLVKERGINYRSLWNEVLHMILLNATRTRAAQGRQVLPIFPAMCFVYNKFFRPELLQKFLITDLKHHSLEISPKSNPPDWLWPLIRRPWAMILALPNNYVPMQPGIDTVYIMLKGYIRGFARPSSILALYTRLRGLLKAGDPIVVAFVITVGPKLHNLIIKALCGHRSTLHLALGIVSDMIKDHTKARKAANIAGRSPKNDEQVLRHPAPDIRTWGILHRGFVAQKQYKEAHEILTTMERHGTYPSLQMFNQLLNSYIYLFRTRDALNVLRRIRQAGHTPDGYTRAHARRLLSLLGTEEKTPEVMELLDIMAQSQDSGPLLEEEEWHDDFENPDSADEGQKLDESQPHSLDDYQPPLDNYQHSLDDNQRLLDEYEQLEAEVSQGIGGVPQPSGDTVDPSAWAETWSEREVEV